MQTDSNRTRSSCSRRPLPLSGKPRCRFAATAPKSPTTACGNARVNRWPLPATPPTPAGTGYPQPEQQQTSGGDIMSTDRPVLSLKRKPARDPQSSDAPVMINGKRMEFPRHRKKVRDNPSSAIDRFNQAVNTPSVKRMKRPGQPSPAKPAPAPTPLPVVTRKKSKPGRPARLMDYQEALDLIGNIWPVLVTEERCRLLKIGITDDMRDNIQARGLDISHKRLSRVLRTLTRSASYLQTQQAGAVRYDIHGLPAGTVTEEEAQSALKRLGALQRSEPKPGTSVASGNP